ncbi:flagellar biosynthetic protein FliO [Bdellovibrio sp. SKB1291214]|uniref:FliO/MopB family protein n=1 Tax=Bdellovibrio sp. SKB1291214 TaxID=1732569 RepID=UPI000B519BCA|nr:flagellar biosynthetic protein FliO [Bdellovibrio sp. SKB1291214]UYL09193.1 flagellar biosynthetic protein FliO [Bdellovibrio sp. SKB1291214]
MKWIFAVLFMISVSAHAADKEAPTSNTAPAAVAAEANNETAAVPAETTTQEAVVSKDLPKIDNRKESEIPLNLENKKNAGTEGSSWFRILMTLSILGLVGCGAFIFLRKYSVPKERKHQTQIKVLQQHYLGPKKSLAIIRVAGESILIGVTDHNISMIKSLSLLDDEIPEEAPKSFGKTMATFDEDEDQFEASSEPRERVTFKTRQKETPAMDADEEFAISGIKDIVSKRLKGMRNFQ